LDAELLLAKVMEFSRVQLYTQFDQPLRENELERFKTLLKRRASREPLAYILGEREFFSLNFKVTSEVLIPRPETEEIVERGLDFLKRQGLQEPRILDLGTGSGCLLIALLKNYPSAYGIGVDQSAKALRVARENAERHGVASRITWLQMDLRGSWKEKDLGDPFDLITGNLPYVSEGDYVELPPELREFEPKGALVPGPTGVEAFGWVLSHLEEKLLFGGWALLEMGADQGGELLAMVKKICPEWKAEILKDLSGRDRILKLRKN
jgi:release factor glutamine methyltransferase